MAKLTKPEARNHAAALELLKKDVLTEDDKEFVFRNWHEGANHVNGAAGAFFTPFEMAFDFAIEVGGGRVLDLCAGIGMLSYAVWCRSAWWERRPQMTCVEVNPAYVEVGRKLVPEATWICADALAVGDLGLGRFDCVISNPPFGNIRREVSGPTYTGKDFELHVIDVASTVAARGVFIVPQMSAGFNYSGRPNGYERQTSGRAVDFQALTGLHFDSGCGVDTAFYRDQWKGVSPICEIVCVEFPDAIPAANDNEPQGDLFGVAA